MALFIATFRYRSDPASLAALRPARYEFFRALQEQGRLLASGQLTSGSLGDGMLVLRAETEPDARELLTDDPFARAGLVVSTELAAWNPTLGSWVEG